MKRSKVEIGEFRLRASGLTKEQGQRLGEMVAQRLANMSANKSGVIPTIRVGLRAEGNEISQLADQIVAKVRRGIE